MSHEDPAFLAWATSRRRHFAAAKERAIARIQSITLDSEFEWEAFVKARRGWAEHDGGIRYMTDGEVDDAAREEVIDQFWYESELEARGRPPRGG